MVVLYYPTPYNTANALACEWHVGTFERSVDTDEIKTVQPPPPVQAPGRRSRVYGASKASFRIPCARRGERPRRISVLLYYYLLRRANSSP